ncbi:MAG: hypothetical protein NWS87_07565 [Sediminibacterium sp.]|nr:hypothetical protein [Sediminibacterium sp.]
MRVLLLITTILLFSCNGYNDKMNSLLERKSELESKFNIADSTSAMFTNKNDTILEVNIKNFNESKASSELSEILNSKEYKSNNDSAKKYLGISRNYLSQLEKLKYSIDSLSKLK